jgi:hypothetical protein
VGDRSDRILLRFLMMTSDYARLRVCPVVGLTKDIDFSARCKSYCCALWVWADGQFEEEAKDRKTSTGMPMHGGCGLVYGGK